MFKCYSSYSVSLFCPKRPVKMDETEAGSLLAQRDVTLDFSYVCFDCRRCRAQTLHHSSDRCQRQQPAQSPYLVCVPRACTCTSRAHTRHPDSDNHNLSMHLTFFCSSSFNRVDIPPYESYDKLYDKLLTAIEETCGFAVE